jgi:hypothetical protein
MYDLPFLPDNGCDIQVPLLEGKWIPENQIVPAHSITLLIIAAVSVSFYLSLMTSPLRADTSTQ